MVLSKSSKQLWDPIRLCYVRATPEEKIRQKWILAMLGPLGYPKGLLAVEKGVSSVLQPSFLSGSNRRFDLLCYMPGKEGLDPLLLVEFKSDDKGDIPVQQVFGYNDLVLAPFVCVIQGEKVSVFWKEKDSIASVPFLPTYSQLISFLS
jgi:hypothetical protein